MRTSHEGYKRTSQRHRLTGNKKIMYEKSITQAGKQGYRCHGCFLGRKFSQLGGLQMDKLSTLACYFNSVILCPPVVVLQMH